MNMPKGFPSGYFMSEQEARISLQSWAGDVSIESQYNNRCITFDTHPWHRFFLNAVDHRTSSPHAGEWYWYIEVVDQACDICGTMCPVNPCWYCVKILQALPDNPNHAREKLHKIIVHLGREVND